MNINSVNPEVASQHGSGRAILRDIPEATHQPSEIELERSKRPRKPDKKIQRIPKKGIYLCILYSEDCEEENLPNSQTYLGGGWEGQVVECIRFILNKIIIKHHCS